jgi:HPt (histidine-containing phosphotransfer) domain-containing protein
MTMFDDTMEGLKQRFLVRAKEDHAVLREHQSGDRRLQPQELRVVVHRLAGCAGIFGYPALSALAQEIDAHLAEHNEAMALPKLLAALDAMIPGTGEHTQ